MADRDTVQALARHAVKEFGRIDVQISNNAACMAYGETDQLRAEVEDRIIAVNLQSQIHSAWAAPPVMKRQGKGVIVDVASLFARMTSPYVSTYATSTFKGSVSRRCCAKNGSPSAACTCAHPARLAGHAGLPASRQLHAVGRLARSCDPARTRRS